MKSGVFWIGVVIIVAAISVFTTIRALRPAKPDLSNTQEWTLIKLDRSLSSPQEIRIYLLKHLSSTWDPYTVEQNKIVAKWDGKPVEFMWPSDRQYAAGWCEVFRLQDGKAEILLFESPSSMRLVFFNQGQFSFRPEKDELLSTNEIAYSDLEHDGVPKFFVTEQGKRKVMKWGPGTGFAEVSQP